MKKIYFYKSGGDTAFNADIFNFNIGFGWYRGETICGFHLQLFKPIEGVSFVIFSLQILKFAFELLWDYE